MERTSQAHCWLNLALTGGLPELVADCTRRFRVGGRADRALANAFEWWAPGGRIAQHVQRGEAYEERLRRRAGGNAERRQ
jgi:hypothetical protein